MKIIFLFLILLSSKIITAQKKVKYDLGIDGVSTTKGVFTYPSIGINFIKTKLQVGLLIGSSFVSDESNIGFQSNFLFSPNKQKENKFDFYFISSFNYFKNSISIGIQKPKLTLFK